jgi:hypothetical protein
MDTNTLKHCIKDALSTASPHTLINAWNTFCTETNDDSGIIYYNNPRTFHALYDGSCPSQDIVKDIVEGSYRSDDHFFRYSGCTGRIVSFDALTDASSSYDADDLADWLVRAYHDDIDEINALLECSISDDYRNSVFTVGDRTFKAIAYAGKCCDKCYFHYRLECQACNLFDCNVLPQCDEDGIGYRCYYVEVKNDCSL